MASIKVLLLLLVLAVTSVAGQYRPITGAEERRLRLRQDPELLALAARTGVSIIIVIDVPSTTAIAQEGVNVNMDCLPWLDGFPGGSIQWSRIPLDLEGQIDGMERVLNPGDRSIVVGGPFNRWLNITRTKISASAQTVDTAIYMCEVCTDRGTPLEECHTANVTLYIIGGPPFIDKAPNNTAVMDNPTRVEYMIGADFCIPLDERRQYTLSCGINSNQRTPTQSRAFPTPDRAWFAQGELLYRVGANDPPPDTRDFLEFFLDPPNRILLAPDSVFPSVLQTRSNGGIQFNFRTDNLTLPEAMYPPGVTADNFRMAAFQAILGDWTCEANNAFGMDTATSTIRICAVCNDLPGIANGSIVYEPESAPRFVNTTATYTCDPGFRFINGDQMRTCAEIANGTQIIDADWGGEEGECLAQCPELELIVNGFITYDPDMIPDFDIGTIAIHQCDSGFILVGVMFRNCTVGSDGTGEWTEEPPTCEPQCAELTGIENGFITYDPDMIPDFDIGTIAIHQCNPGFVVVGVMFRNCTLGIDGTGEWNEEPPTCELIQHQCPVGSYEEDLSTGESACVPCPTNSFSTMEDSRECICFDGYFRTVLEGPNYPCTSPPSACRPLQIIPERTRATTITVRWDRPEIIGREDFYYNILYSEDNQTFIQHNPRPYIKQDAVVDYALSGLKALTMYTIRVSVENGVSDQDELNTRSCEVTGSTGDTRANAPSLVLGQCTIVVWTAPTRTYGRIIGYDVNFVLPGPEEDVMFAKGSRELFHVIGDEIAPSNEMSTLVQVRAKTSSANGRWSELVPLGCAERPTCSP